MCLALLMIGLTFMMAFISSRTTLWENKYLHWENKHSISRKKNLVLSPLSGKGQVTGLFKPSDKQLKQASQLYTVNPEPDCQDSKLQLFLKLWLQDVYQLLHISQYIICVHGWLINLVQKLRSKNIYLD